MSCDSDDGIAIDVKTVGEKKFLSVKNEKRGLKTF